MATDAVRDAADDMMGSNSRGPGNRDLPTSPHEISPNPQVSQARQGQPPEVQASMSYAWTTTDSVFSRNVDRWISGDLGSPRTGVQPNRFATLHRPTLQQPTLPPTPALSPSGCWMIAALALPLLNLGGTRNWRCSPSTVLNTMELFLSQVSGYCSRVRSRIRNMTRDQGATDVFASLMDVVLVVYAIGFLIISMYQASMFQQF